MCVIDYCARPRAWIFEGGVNAFPSPPQVGHLPDPMQFRHFGSSSFKCVLLPVPLHSTHLPSSLHSEQRGSLGNKRAVIVPPLPRFLRASHSPIVRSLPPGRPPYRSLNA